MWEKGLDYVVAGKTSLIELYNQIGNKDAINNLINNLQEDIWTKLLFKQIIYEIVNSILIFFAHQKTYSAK